MFKKLSLLLILVMLMTICGGCSREKESDSDEPYKLLYGIPSTIHDGASAETAPASGLSNEIPGATEAPVCNAEYFIFTKTTNTLTDNSGLPLLYENQCVPIYTSMNPQRSQWVSGILDSIARDYASNSRYLYDYAQEFVAQNGTDGFYSHSNYQQLGITRHDDTVVSLICLSSLYSGGTHPNSVQTSYNLDVVNQRVLRLEDVIAEDGAADLAAMVHSRVEEKFAGLGLFDDYAATIGSSMEYGNMTAYWYLNDTGLVIFYNQYELGPYAAGIIKVELPYEELDGILLEQFQPIPSTGVPGDLLLRGEWDGYHSIPITIEAEGERLLVGTEGKVYQVQLSEVLWLEGTPIARELIFSARTLCQNDVLEITGGFDDETRSFAIEFIDGLGQHRLYYLHAGELSEEP